MVLNLVKQKIMLVILEILKNFLAKKSIRVPLLAEETSDKEYKHVLHVWNKF